MELIREHVVIALILTIDRRYVLDEVKAAGEESQAV